MRGKGSLSHEQRRAWQGVTESRHSDLEKESSTGTATPIETLLAEETMKGEDAWGHFVEIKPV